MSYFNYASQPIRDLGLTVQSALIDDDPQQAVEHLVKRYAAEMAKELREAIADTCARLLDEWAGGEVPSMPNKDYLDALQALDDACRRSSWGSPAVDRQPCLLDTLRGQSALNISTTNRVIPAEDQSRASGLAGSAGKIPTMNSAKVNAFNTVKNDPPMAKWSVSDAVISDRVLRVGRMFLDGGDHSLTLLNTTIIPSQAEEGDFAIWDITLDEARWLILCAGVAMDENHGWLKSAIGHEATAAAFKAAAGQGWYDRTPWDGSGFGLALQLQGRAPEGKILTLKEMEEMGYKFRLIFRSARSLSARVRELEDELSAVKAAIKCNADSRLLPRVDEPWAPGHKTVRLEALEATKDDEEQIVLPDVVVKYGISQEAWCALSPAERVDMVDHMIQDEKDRGW